MKGKRGQFYLIAAIVIIGIIIGYAAISNYLEREESTKVYDLGEELGIESAEVLDYGKFNEFDDVNMTNLLLSFIEAYSEYGEIEKLYFIYGDKDKIIVMGYQELEGEIFIETETDINIEPLKIKKKIPSSKEYLYPGNRVVITVNGISYEFTLKPGENFYFIIVVTEEGEEHVVTG